jgi:virginiamycin A acetyltransferase
MAEKEQLGLRGLVQAIAVGVGILLTSPLAALARLDMALLGRDEWFKSCAQLLSLFPGRIGSYLRVAFYFMTLDRCGIRWTMQIFSKFTHPQVEVGAGTYIGMHSTLGRVKLGEKVLVADYVQVLSGKHQHGTPDSWAGKHAGGKLTQVAIGAGTWIGGGAIVMADVGSGCIVGAGSVVTGPVADGMVVAGNPARVLRSTSAASTASSGGGEAG